MFEIYASSLTGLWLILTTVFVQALIAMVAHRSQKQYIPGITDPSLGHESFVFRSERTFLNSLENTLPFAVMAFLAMMVGVNASWLCYAVWTYAVARLIHMVLYYVIATEKNPSPRSYFYVVGLLAMIAVIVITAMALFS